MLLVTIAVNAGLSDVFLTVPNQINLFQLSIEKIIVALIMTLVIVNGEIDLSVASMMGLAACAFGWLFQAGGPGAAGLPDRARHRRGRRRLQRVSGSPESASRRWWSPWQC